MTSDQPPPSGPSGQRPRRPPPTIDVKATEVASEAGAKAAAEGDASATAAAAAAGGARSDKPAAEPETPPRRDAIAWWPLDVPWPLIGVPVVSAILAAAIFSMTGLWLGREDTESALGTRLARLEQQVRELAARPTPAGVEQKSVDDLAARLARVESAAAAPRLQPSDPALANRVAQLESEVRALGDTAARLSELAQRPAPSTPAGVDAAATDALTGRISRLEQVTKTLEAQLAARAQANGADRAVRLALAATALRDAVARGDAFDAELAAAKALAPDAKALAPLEPFAAAGVPSAAALARELAQISPSLWKAVAPTARDGGFLDRLAANAEKLVRVRPLGDTPGDDPAAVVARIEAAATRSDLAAALAELGKLAPDARAPAQAWIAKTQARSAAIEASRRFAGDALAQLAKPAP
jgi:hypothetical protein